MTDPPERRKGSQPYLPPPPDDSPESVDVPRMEPPPASLEAMVRSRPGSPTSAERDSTWLWVSVLLAVGVAIIVYILRSAN